ncbi:MAG: phage tail sheath family protein [Actinomycetota bacterium]
MPEYLAPGVYVEEIAGPRSIEGVSTSTAGFIGPTRFGPTSGDPALLTSFADFERIFGDADDLFLGGSQMPNYLAHAARGFFDEGGRRLYVSRTFRYNPASLPSGRHPTADHAWASVAPGSFPPAKPATLRARFPGMAGNMRVVLTLRVGANALTGDKSNLTRVHRYDLVYVDGGASGLHVVDRGPSGTWILAGGAAATLAGASNVYPLTAVVEVSFPTTDSQGIPGFGPLSLVGAFGFDPRASNALTAVLTPSPLNGEQFLTVPVAIEGFGELSGNEAGITIATTLFGASNIANIPANAPGFKTPPEQALVPTRITLAGGTDGQAPIEATFAGDGFAFHDYQNDPLQVPKNGLLAFEGVDDISIVAAPGACTGWKEPADSFLAHQFESAVLTHCEKLKYRVAALETPPGLLPTAALAFRNERSSSYGALYYPWITIASPVDGSPLNVPPAGHMCGVWARTDNDRGVFKSPANEVVRTALDFEVRINKAQQELLNPDGVNCLRFFPGPGFLVWGARTLSEDPEWKYLSVRRYFAYLEHSIDRGTQWVVFEVNNEALWAAVRHTVEDFLLSEWKSGALMGTDPKQAYMVRCDRSTMTQNDLDNGRLVCVIGVAVAKPAEFVIFRIGQMTASAGQ